VHSRTAALAGEVLVLTRLREILFPTLVMAIIGSLWLVGRAQEMEDDIRHGVGPSPRWTALVDSLPMTDAE
jgi:hypothetical protein